MIGEFIPIWHALIGLIIGVIWGAKRGYRAPPQLLWLAVVAAAYAGFGWLALQQMAGEAAPGLLNIVWLFLGACIVLLAGYWLGLKIEKQ